MVIVIDMQSGEREAYEAAEQRGAGTLLSDSGWLCPVAEPELQLDERKQILPALMEHAFNTPRY